MAPEQPGSCAYGKSSYKRVLRSLPGTPGEGATMSKYMEKEKITGYQKALKAFIPQITAGTIVKLVAPGGRLFR